MSKNVLLGNCEYCKKKLKAWVGKRCDFKGRKNHLSCWIKTQEELKIIMLCDNIKGV